MAQRGSSILTYHNTDVAFALQLATDLRNRGVDVFMDRLDIQPNDDWNGTHSNALVQCSALITVLSPAYARSSFGRNAIAHIAKLGRPIIPVMFGLQAATDYPSGVNYRDAVSMLEWQTEQVYSRGLDQLIASLVATKVVNIQRRIDPEIRYVNYLNMIVESYKSHLELPMPADELDAHSLVPPRPRMEAQWGLGGTYMARGVTLQEASVISSLAEYARQTPRFVLIGASGMGKTTSLMRLMSEHIRAYLSDPHHVPVPLWADLSTWVPDQDVNSFLSQQWKMGSDPSSDIHKGRIAVYMDGLSEMSIHTNVKLNQLREWLHHKKRPMRVIIACDQALFSTCYGFDLPVVSMPSVAGAQTRDIQNLIMGRDSQTFSESLRQHPLGARWSSNLFMLRHAMVYARTTSFELPPTTEQLLVRVVSTQWQREQVNNNPDWQPFSDILPRLCSFASLMVQEGAPYSVTPELAAHWLGSESLLHALLSARVLLVRHKRIKFWHRQLLSVFAAFTLTEAPIHDQMGYTEFDSQGRRIAHHWDSVIVALAGILDDPERLLLQVADIDPYLALDALAGVQVRADIADTIYERLMHFALSANTVGYEATFDVLDNATFGNAIGTVLRLLREGSWQRRQLAHKFLLRLKYTVAEDLQAILKWDGTISNDLRVLFVNIGDEGVPLLLQLLASPLPAVRKGVIWALTEALQDRAALVGVVQMLDDDMPDVRLQAIHALTLMPEPQAVPVLIVHLRDAEEQVRKAASHALGLAGSAAIPGLLHMLHSPDPIAKRFAIGTLGRTGDSTVVDDIVPFLQDSNANLRAVAAMALADLAHPSAVTALSQCANDTFAPDWIKISIADLARRALERINTEDSVSIIGRLFGGSTAVRKSGSGVDAAKRIKEDKIANPVSYATAPEEVVTPIVLPAPTLKPHEGDNEELETILSRMRQPDKRSQCEAAAELIAMSKKWHGIFNPHIIQRIEMGLYDDSAFIRENTVVALAYIGNSSVVSALVSTTLNDPEWLIRQATLRALAEINDASVVTHIIPLLKNPRVGVREVAAEVLGHFHHPMALPALIEATTDEDMYMRYTVVRAITAIGDASASRTLLPMLHIRDIELRALIIRALGVIRAEDAVPALGKMVASNQKSQFFNNSTLGSLAEVALTDIGTTIALRVLSEQMLKKARKGSA